MKLFLLLALALPLAAQSLAEADGGARVLPAPTRTAPDIPIKATMPELETLKARIAELEKQLAQQAALYRQQVNDFATQSNSCTANFAVYKVTHPDQKAEQATGEKK